jgi:FKBP-type peptidyl-prolyl cis-trans isomerase
MEEQKEDKQINIGQTVAIFVFLLALVAVAIYMGGKVKSKSSQPATSSQPGLQFGQSQQGSASATTEENMNNNQDNQGLKIEDIKIGDGEEAVNGKKAVVNYTGMLTNGTVFDSSYQRNQPFAFTLGAGEVIKGWDQGVLGMRVGGKRRLTIPPELGYGEFGAGSLIPPNSTLVFEIELLRLE